MGSDAMILVFWMLSFKPTFSLSSFTFIKRLFFSPRKDIEASERDSVTWCICIRCLWEGTKKKKNLPTVATGREGNWELREGSKGSFLTLTSLCLLHTVLCAPITCISTYAIIHGERSCRRHVGSIPPPACLLSKEAWWAPAEPGQLWILSTLVMLAGAVGRLYTVSPVHLLREKACQEFWRHRGYWHEVRDTKIK